jgi:hypothetical protein
MRTRSIGLAPGRGLWLLALASACNPYHNRSGEFSAGPADPLNYPPPSLGAGGDRTKAGKGSFTEVKAYAASVPIGYFAFAFASAVGPTQKGVDPLRLIDDGMVYPQVPTPRAYTFDPSQNSPYPATPTCVAPNDYVYDAQRDELRYDDQGSIFTALPTATYVAGALPTWSYEPVVAEVPVTTSGMGCQSVTTEAGVLASPAASVADPDGKYLAWAIIDTGAAVYRVGQSIASSSGVTVQRYGWFEHFIVAYLDGGYIPTESGTGDGHPVVRMKTQKLYYPRSMVTTMVKGMAVTATGAIGQGYDVLESARTDVGYSPVCAVFTYDVGATVASSQLPRDAQTIETTYGATLQAATTPYVYCLQAE